VPFGIHLADLIDSGDGMFGDEPQSAAPEQQPVADGIFSDIGYGAHPLYSAADQQKREAEEQERSDQNPFPAEQEGDQQCRRNCNISSPGISQRQHQQLHDACGRRHRRQRLERNPFARQQKQQQRQRQHDGHDQKRRTNIRRFKP